MTNLDPKHLDALIMSMRKMERQMSFQSRDLAGAKNCRGAIDKITALRAENDRLSNLWQIEHDHATALRAQIDRERAATIEAAAGVADYYADANYCAMGYPEDGGIAASGTADMVRRDIRALHTDATRAAMDAIRRDARAQSLREAAALCVSLRKEADRPEAEAVGCMDCASAILALAASIPPDPDTNADSRQQTAPKESGGAK